MKKNPQSAWWKEIRRCCSLVYPIYALKYGIVDVIALFKQFPNDDSLSMKFYHLFDKFVFLDREDVAFKDFICLFSNSMNLNQRQIKQLVWGLTKAPQFLKKRRALEFVASLVADDDALDCQSLLSYPSTPPYVLFLMKEFILLNADSSEDKYYLTAFVKLLTTKEKMTAFIEALNLCP